jgi:lipopolysaccharide export system permease protein
VKRLYVFSVRSFAGPFLVTFCISMFMLIMQFFWKYIDDLMGKGISIKVILELLFYVSADIIPLALPLAILLSSIMTLGNLAENNELTALKSSGLSLFRIMKPLTTVVLLIAFCTFCFANYVIPVATLKWHSLIYDIQNTKISAVLTPGVFSDKIDGYAIKVKKGTNNHFEGILIQVKNDPSKIKTVRAKEGTIYKSLNGKHLFFKLEDGFVTEELAPQSPSFLSNGTLIKNSSNSHPARRYSFSTATYKIDITGFDLSRSDEELFKNTHEMLNVFQINRMIDSIQKEADKISSSFLTSLKMEHLYYQAKAFKEDTTKGLETANNLIIPKGAIPIDSLSTHEKITALSQLPSSLRRINQNLQGRSDYMDILTQNMNMYYIGFHRKFALTYAIIVLFFVGAPLGAIVRKGGFGTPLVLAVLLFMVYFILISIGQSLATENIVNPFLGMWFASLILTPIAILLMRAAANDSQVLKIESYKLFFTRFKRKK